MYPIVAAGLIAGTIDLGAACLINWVTPFVICQAVASGLLGRASFQQGWTSAVLGLVLQWLMSILIAAFCYLAAQRIALLRKSWLGAGLAYGVVTFFVMNYVVMPLSAVGHRPHFNAQSFVENLIAMLVFGLIVSFILNAARGGRAPHPTDPAPRP